MSKEFSELTAALEQAEERTEGLEARVSAIDRLVREGLLTAGPPDSSSHSSDVADVEEQLAALQSEVARQPGG